MLSLNLRKRHDSSSSCSLQVVKNACLVPYQANCYMLEFQLLLTVSLSKLMLWVKKTVSSTNESNSVLLWCYSWTMYLTSWMSPRTLMVPCYLWKKTIMLPKTSFTYYGRCTASKNSKCHKLVYIQICSSFSKVMDLLNMTVLLVKFLESFTSYTSNPSLVSGDRHTGSLDSYFKWESCLSETSDM